MDPEPKKEFFHHGGMRIVAYVILFLELTLSAVILGYFAEASTAGTWGDLGGTAMNLVFGIPLGIAGNIAAYFSGRSRPLLGWILGVLSLALVLQVPTLLGGAFFTP